MRLTAPFEFPEDRQAASRQARWLEWISIIYLLSVILLMYLVMGSSQAMKTAWIEDLLSLVPPIAFLIANRICGKRPTVEYPYGFHRATNIAFLFAAFALLAMGLFLAYEAIVKLVTAEHPAIGGVEVFGRTIWLGWLMIPVLLWATIPVIFIGRAKLKVAEQLHDKSLHADASMNKADWLTGAAAMAGVIGIAFGWWWADAAAALIISLDILKDGFTNTREVIGDLMDRRPQTVDHQTWKEVPDDMVAAIEQLDWVESAEVRLREHGHLIFGDAVVVPRSDSVTSEQLATAAEAACEIDWRIHDVVVQAVKR